MTSTAPKQPGVDDERGAAAVETAVCLALVVLPLLFGLVGCGFMFSFRQALSQASAEGARAAVGVPTGQPLQLAPAARAAVTQTLRPYGITCESDGTLRRPEGGAPVRVGTCAVTTTCTASLYTDPCSVTVEVVHDYRDHSLLPNLPLMGLTLPKQIVMTSTVEAR